MEDREQLMYTLKKDEIMSDMITVLEKSCGSFRFAKEMGTDLPTELYKTIAVRLSQALQSECSFEDPVSKKEVYSPKVSKLIFTELKKHVLTNIRRHKVKSDKAIWTSALKLLNHIDEESMGWGTV